MNKLEASPEALMNNIFDVQLTLSSGASFPSNEPGVAGHLQAANYSSTSQ